MKQYRHLFFDLDRTLWDFEANAEETLKDIYLNYQLQQKGIPSFEDFKNSYRTINKNLWEQYKLDQITKERLSVERFRQTLEYFTIKDEALAKNIADDYITISPTKTRLFPNVHDTLHYLSPKYQMHILTNGFNEVQFVKLERAGLRKYFDAIITSENAGSKKPDPGIFEHALVQTHAVRDESLVIGDDPESDIEGAANTGIDQVFVNYQQLNNGIEPTYEITDLKELQRIL